MSTNPNPTKASPLQRALAARLVELLRGQALPAGSALTELGLSQQLGVSRTPVRAALGLLEQEGLVTKGNRAWQLLRDGASLARLETELPVAETERLFVEIARDRVQGLLPSDISEADLMRRYKATRPTVLKVLARLAEVGLVERKTGHGWSFLPAGFDAETRRESYRFRMVIEPSALLEPAFELDPAWAADMRRRHEAMLAQPWHETAAVALFDLNAEFHEGLAAASGNRFFQMAVAQQNRLRRFVNVHWPYGVDRVTVSCREHLDILARAEAGELQVASALMRQHLQGAVSLSPKNKAGADAGA